MTRLGEGARARLRRYLPAPGGAKPTEWELLVLLGISFAVGIGLAGDVWTRLLDPFSAPAGVVGGWKVVQLAGMALVAVWLVVGVLRRGAAWVGSVLPVVVGSGLLLVALLVDHWWHGRFGPEVMLETLVSPPHLLSLTGVLLILATPIVVLWSLPARRLGLVSSLCVALPLVFGLQIVSLFTGFASPLAGGMTLTYGYVEPVVGESMVEYDQIRGLASVAWSAALFSAALTIVLVRFRLVPGFVALTMVAVAGPTLAITGREILPLVVGFVVAGAVSEAVIALTGGPTLGRGAAVLNGALMCAALWLVAFRVLDMDERLNWSTSLWSGSVVLATLVGAAAAGLIALAVPSRVGIDLSSSVPHPV